jgi:PilZ domain
VAERRRARRYAVSWTSEVSSGSALPFVVEVVNVSDNGLGTVGVKSMAIGQEFYFKVTGWNVAPLKGVVRWIEGFEGPTYAGVEFIEMDADQTAALHELIGKFDVEDWGKTITPEA